MRERIGFIIGIAGIVLLINPDFNQDQMMMYADNIISNYWPVGLILISMILINPKHKKTRTRNR